MRVSSFLILLVGACFWSCSSSPEIQQGREESEPLLLGWVDRVMLGQSDNSKFRISYDTAQVQKDLVELVHEVREAADWLVFFGSWCSDSRREVPRFLKVADVAGIPRERIRLYGLDQSKGDPDGLVERYRIERVPTFIALAQGQEIGRISETPRVTMEADMLLLLARTR